VSVADLLADVPAGWSVATYRGRRYGVTKTLRAGGRSVSVYAEELGGPDVVSANLYLAEAGEAFRPCEMPAEKVLAFLRGATYTHDDPGAEAPGS
jgi:hypothetical protein